MNITAGVTVAAISMMCYLVVEGVKCTPLNTKWLPVIAGLLGGGLGVAALYVMPDFPTDNIMSAIAIGIESGLAATGINQVFKQLTKDENKK